MKVFKITFVLKMSGDCVTISDSEENALKEFEEYVKEHHSHIYKRSGLKIYKIEEIPMTEKVVCHFSDGIYS